MTTADPRSVEVVDVYRNTTLVGTLRRTPHGALFEYELGYDARTTRQLADLMKKRLSELGLTT